MSIHDKFFSCLISGAIGDALGYPVEFSSLEKIKAQYGEDGITDLVLDSQSRKSNISDDTQMTLFTVDGLIWAYLRCSERGVGSYAGSGVYQSYLRWLYTQTGRINDESWLKRQPHERDIDLPILDIKELYEQRMPGGTCLSSLRSGIKGTRENPINNSKGCGGVMRVAPVGLFLHNEPEYSFEIGSDIAALTHGHPTGYLSAGAFSMIIAEIINGKTVLDSVRSVNAILEGYPHHKETTNILNKALTLAFCDQSPEKSIRDLGEGWVAEEALAIAVYCALKETDFRKAIIMSVNHDGDSDSTGSICGNIMGARMGTEGIPSEWIRKVELSDFIKIMADRLFEVYQYKNN